MKVKKKYECSECGSEIVNDGMIQKCSCGSSNLKFIQNIYPEESLTDSLEKFKQKELLDLVKDELSKDHLEDDNLKMTNFLCCVSGLSPNPKLRKSIANKGNSAEGKDNVILTCLKHMPDGSFIYLTSGTQSTIEDDIKDIRIIAFSEVNVNREVGANKFLTEVIKQKAEGGTSSIKKDIRKGMKEARHDTGEQSTVLYGTTEIQGDEELSTRFIEGNIKCTPQRIKKVNDNSLDTFSDLNKLIKSDNIPSWIKIGLTYLYNLKPQMFIYLPYAKFLKEKIDGEDIFDNNSARSQRDLKRLLALTCATTYLFQLQRNKVIHEGITFIVSEPQDLLNTIKLSGEFFNQSYSGIDARVMRVLKVMEEIGTEWVDRTLIEEKLGYSKNTIKDYCRLLSAEGCLKGIKGSQLNEEIGIKTYDGNRIYYKRYQKGIKKPLIRCQLTKLKEFLEEKTKTDLTPFIINDKDTEKVSKEGYQNDTPDIDFSVNEPIIDTFNLTPLYCGRSFNNGFESLICGQLMKDGSNFICDECKVKKEGSKI